METESVTTLINTVGFPIATCITLFWVLKTLGVKGIEVISQFKDAINNNTKSIDSLASKIEGINNVRINK